MHRMDQLVVDRAKSGLRRRLISLSYILRALIRRLEVWFVGDYKGLGFVVIIVDAAKSTKAT